MIYVPLSDRGRGSDLPSSGYPQGPSRAPLHLDLSELVGRHFSLICLFLLSLLALMQSATVTNNDAQPVLGKGQEGGPL